MELRHEHQPESFAQTTQQIFRQILQENVRKLEKKIGNRILRVLKKGQEKMTVLGSIFAVAIQEGMMVAGLGKTLKVDDQFVLDLNG